MKDRPPDPGRTLEPKYNLWQPSDEPPVPRRARTRLKPLPVYSAHFCKTHPNILKNVCLFVCLMGCYSAELKGPRQIVRIRPQTFDFEPESGLKLGQTKPEISGTVPTNRCTTIPNDYGPISACFDDDPKQRNCEIAQPRSTIGKRILSATVFAGN